MQRTYQARWALAVAFTLLCLGCLWAWLARGYGEVSPRGYQYAMALVSACNRRDLPRVQQIVESIDASRAAEEMPKQDARVLLKIAERAAQGDWEWSSRQIRQLMMDQIRQSPNLPEP